MQKLVIQLPTSLVKYDPPIAINQSEKQQNIDNIRQGKANLKDILNVLLPPRKFNLQKDGNTITYIQYAEQDKLKRQDVDNLKQKLQGFLKVRKARNQPICPIRQQIFAQAFDEIIRQVLLDCPQRGIMLNRVKNESYLTIAAYRTMYQESLLFSKSKISLQQFDLSQYQKQQKQLCEKQRKLKERQIYLLSKKQSIQQKSRQIKTIYKQKREHEWSELKYQQEGLVNFLKSMNRFNKQNSKQDINETEINKDNNNQDVDKD